MASLNIEPKTNEEEIQLLKEDVGKLRHDFNNIKMMLDYMFIELESLIDIIKNGDDDDVDE